MSAPLRCICASTADFILPTDMAAAEDLDGDRRMEWDSADSKICQMIDFRLIVRYFGRYPISCIVYFYGYKITFSWTLHRPNHGERLFEKPQHLLNYRQNKKTLRTASGTINYYKMPICGKTQTSTSRSRLKQVMIQAKCV